MSLLSLCILGFILLSRITEQKNIYFTQSIYDLWCQENILSNSLLLYPNQIPIGISHTSNIKSIDYELIDNNHFNLFSVHTKYIGDFYFFILNITRSLEINREYQDIYILHIQAKISTIQRSYTEQATINLHVADSNDNDAVFDLDMYSKSFTEPLTVHQSLIHFHASDADEIQHGQILYELSSFHHVFSLHPLTGELYLISIDNLQSIYEFDIYAYDRHRKYLIDHDMKTKAHVKLTFPARNISHEIITIFNETIQFKEMVSSYQISVIQTTNWNLMNIHQPIITIEIIPELSTFEIFILKNSSSNSINLFFHQNEIYLNNITFQQYDLHLLLCFFNRTECQYISHQLTPSIQQNISQFYFKSIPSIVLEEDLPIHSYITHIQLQSNEIFPIKYKLLTNQQQFYLEQTTGVLRLALPLKYDRYLVEIQAEINLFTELYFVKTRIEIYTEEINKYPPEFSNHTLNEFVQLPYQFQAYDHDENKETNGRISYRLWNCLNDCPLEIDSNTGLVDFRKEDYFLEQKIYDLQIIAFDWGQPRSLESRIHFSLEFFHHDLQTISNNQSIQYSLTILDRSVYSSKFETIDLHIGFKQHSKTYYLSEDMQINTIIDYLPITIDSFPLFINDEKENLFSYIINDTSVPFTIDSNEKTIKLIHSLDREKQMEYHFDVELRLKSTYAIKLQEFYTIQNKNTSFHFQYSKKFYQKMIFTIYINDVNDNVPRCHSFHNHIYLNENQIQFNIFHVHGYDPDQNENGTITYSLLNYNQYFTIDSSTGQINSIQPIDREQIPFLLLYILASDQGQQIQFQSICMTLHVTIMDVNDNIPQFSLTNYTFDVFSDLPRETIIGQVFASDADLSTKLIYSIDSNPWIKINQSTGYLQLKFDLHRFTDQIFNITVRVFDGIHRNQTWISIRIKRFISVQEPILVSTPAYSVVINQSTPVGTIVTNIYQRLQLDKTSIDFIEIIREETIVLFTIDQQGSIHLVQSLPDTTNLSYWLSIRLTRYYAHPPHSFIRVYISINEENFYLPQCVDNYQQIKLYDYSIQYPFINIQAITFYDNIHLQYSLLNDTTNEKIFAIDKQTGFIQLLWPHQTIRLSKSNYLLTIHALDSQHQLSVDCYLKVDLIQRKQLTPKFIHSPIYNIDLVDISSSSTRIRQRLFQIIALLENDSYEKNLEVRYRITDLNQYFIINRQTGYIATKQPLYPYTTYQFNIEAFTVAHYDDIGLEENELDEQSDRRKWRIVSSRVILPVKIRIRPIRTIKTILLPMNQSTIQIVLLTTIKVGSTILHLGMNTTHTQWFILISHIDHTRYFHVDFETGELILTRPLIELINKTTIIELHINVTNDWIHWNTIKIVISIQNIQLPQIHFSQTDYYSSVSKNLPIGIEIARLTIENPFENCTYKIHSVEKIKSKDFFRIHPLSGSIIIIQSLENSISEQHLLSIVYHCSSISYLTFTRFHINILDKERLKYQGNHFYRFSHDNYLVIFETSLIRNQKKYLLDLELVNNKNYAKRIRSDAQIIEGDPLGLFSIDPLNQSLVLLDESRARSYIYPLQLTIIDTLQKEPITCTVTLLISNINIQFTCPLHIHHSPYLYTYKSIPRSSIDPFTGQQYDPYNSLTILGFDPFTPTNVAVCSITLNQQSSKKSIDFIFEKEFYYGYINHTLIVYNNNEPLRITIKNRENYSNPFDIIYEFLDQTDSNPFHFDQYTGYINYIPRRYFSKQYSFLLRAKYQTLLAFTRLTIFIHSYQESTYTFKLLKPFVSNYTIGYLNEIDSNLKIFDKKIASMFSIDRNKRLFIKNASLISTKENFFDFLIGTIQIQINILSKEILQCSLNRIHSTITNDLIGFIEVLNTKAKQSFYLLNHNDLFHLDHAYGLLRYQDQYSIVADDLILLIEVENSRCLLELNKSLTRTSVIVQKNDDLEIERFGGIKQFQNKIKLHTSSLINNDIISPIFFQRSYTFSLHFPNNLNQPTFLGQISAQPYYQNRSHLVYHLLSPTKHFYINPDNGTVQYIPNEFYNQTTSQLQIIVRDLIYQQQATTNVTIYTCHPEMRTFSSSIYHQTLPEILPPGSIIFQPNLSHIENLHYSLLDYDSTLFEINSNTGQVILLNHLSKSFYSFKMHISPFNQILIIKLTVLDYNNHPPIFLNLPSNLTISSDDIFVTKLFAHDLDLFDNEHLIYYLLDENQQKFFSINHKTGIITLNTSIDQTMINLKIGVSDGWHRTTKYLPIIINNFSKTAPKFSAEEYSFPYNKILGQIFAYDSDPNDQIIYQLYLEPDGIQINQYSGLITSNKTFFSQTIEFYASAIDRAQQIVYTKIKLFSPIQPKFTSYLYSIPLIPPIKIPSEIFHFHLVDLFHQTLSSGRFEIDHPTNLLEINQNKLILKQYLHPSKIYQFDINGYWKNFTCQTTIQIIFIDKNILLNRKSYEYQFETSTLKPNYLIETFSRRNFSMKILSTPLTINNCTENFYLNQNQLYFNTQPILSNLCFFELEFIDEKMISISQMKISFLPSDIKPIFSSNVYYFYTKNIQVFAESSNTIRYKLQTNSFGLLINQTTGIISFKYTSNKLKNIVHIQLFVYAIDEKTFLNDTAVIHIIFKRRKDFEIPTKIPLCSNISISISDQSLSGTIIRDIHFKKNNTNHYYILSGDKYGMFSINSFGQLYLVSSLLNQTAEEYFELIILTSSYLLSYCRTNISIVRTPKWSNFICPSMPIEWMIVEEAPLNTIIGNIKNVLSIINNNSLSINMSLDHMNNDSRSFHLNSTTGLLTIKSRLDYEEKTSYQFSIFLQPNQLNCSLLLIIKLNNILDNPITFHKNSLVHNIPENNHIPFYIGRIQLIDLDHLSFFQYKFYLKNSTTEISIDIMTGSIVLLTKLDREIHGEKLQYEIIALNDFTQKNLIDTLIININDLNDHGPFFPEDIYQLKINRSIRPGTMLAQINATSLDPMNNGRITYRLINSSSIFSIEKQTAKIYLNEFLPLTITNLTFTIEAFEDEVNLTDQRNVFLTIINDDYIYYRFDNIQRCFLDENQPYGTNICVIGRYSKDFIYQLNNSMDYFEIISDNGTILSRKIFDYEIDPHEYNLTVIVHDRDNQSILLSILNFTIFIRNINDNSPEFLIENFTTLFYLYSPLIHTTLYIIEAIDKDQSKLTFEILNNPLSMYTLRSSSNSTEVILEKSITHNQEDNLIIRVLDNDKLFSDLHLRLIYYQHQIDYPKILSQTIDGYINLDENSSNIKLGELLIENHSQYSTIYFNLLPHKSFFLQQLSSNQTELYFKLFNHTSLITFELQLIAFIPSKSIPNIILQNKTKLFFPSIIQPQTLHIHLWSINNEMLNRTISLIIKRESNTTSEQFISHHLPIIRQKLAEILNVQLYRVHIYTFDFQDNHIELLIAISRLTSFRYIHRKILYNILKNSTNIFEKILLNQCQTNPCENNAPCTSHIHLLDNQYEYFISNTYQRLIPKYQRNIQFYKPSPCSSNPCLTMERCIEHSPTLYTCQCMDDSCNYEYETMENSLECININSPTCRDSINTLTFDGFAFIRMNLTVNFLHHFNLTFSFRTESIQGKLLKLTYMNANLHSFDIQIIDGYINFEMNGKNLLQLNQMSIHDGQWHDFDFSIDYSQHYSYYLLRLDHVFSKKISLFQKIDSLNFTQLIMGSDFDGCMGNLTLNNEIISFQNETNSDSSIEFIGTKTNCQFAEVIREYFDYDDICSSYHPCYHGNLCTNYGLSFICNCSNTRFIGRQCQIDLHPCESHPCQFDEQCFPFASNSNQSYTCIPTFVSLSIVLRRSIYIALTILIIVCILLIIMMIYCKKRQANFNQRNLSVSSPLLIHKSSVGIDQIESPIQTLVKLDGEKKQMTSMDNVPSNRILRRLSNECAHGIRNTDSKYYSSIEQMNYHDHYTSIDYEHINNVQPIDVFDFSSSPTQYFNIHNSDSQINYRIRMNTLSDLTENLIESNDIDLTDSSNMSSENDQVLSKPLISTRDDKHSFPHNHLNMVTSTISLSDVPVYARIVRTPKTINNGINTVEHLRMKNPLTSTPTLFIKPINNMNDQRRNFAFNTAPTIDRFKHTSDSDLYDDDEKSSESSSFFQTDV
ncbi:hypothetical protein I4U23_024742 [Adineta vaga]|nr:hypothetical protein I4U23_024742 [Adineta vaga]